MDPGNWYRVPRSICCFSFPGYLWERSLQQTQLITQSAVSNLAATLARLQYVGQRMVGKIKSGVPG